MLRNPYYTGVVTWRGLQFAGNHPALVTDETYQRVQEVLSAHGRSGERAYSSSNYLAGTLFCDLCESKLAYSISTGSGGRRYAYWFCIGRHTYNNGCELPYLRPDEVEQAVNRHWLDESFDADTIEWLRTDLGSAMAAQAKQDEAEVAQLRRQVESIERERMKWAEKSMSGAVPDDIARDKQADLGRQLAAAQSALSGHVRVAGDAAPRLRELMALIEDCSDVYQRASEQVRRLYNQAWFRRIMISTVEDRPTVTGVERTDLLEAVHTLSDRPPHTPKPVQKKRSGSFHCRTIVRGLVSRVESLVDLCKPESKEWQPLLAHRAANPPKPGQVAESGREAAQAGAGGPSGAPAPRSTQVHLPAKRQAEVVALYREGVAVKEIAARFKIHRATVGEICKRHGVELRNPSRGMSEAQIALATRLYEEGASLATVGKQLGLNDGTIRRALLGAGVRLRPRPGR